MDISWALLNYAEFDTPVKVLATPFVRNFAATAFHYLVDARHGWRTAVTLRAEHHWADPFTNEDPVHGICTPLSQLHVRGCGARAVRIAVKLNHRSRRQLLDLLGNPPQESEASRWDLCTIGRENDDWEIKRCQI